MYSYIFGYENIFCLIFIELICVHIRGFPIQGCGPYVNYQTLAIETLYIYDRRYTFFYSAYEVASLINCNFA